MRTKQLITTLCLLAALTSMQAALAQDSKIETAIPKEAAAAIEAGNWAEVVTILKPLATAAEAAEPVHYWYGVARFHQEEYMGSFVKHLTAALEANPRSRITAQYLARAAAKMIITKDAVKTIQPAMEAFADDPVILQAAAKIQAKLYWSHYRPGKDLTQAALDLETAREYLEKALAIDPSDYQTHLDLVEVLNLSGESQLAIRHILMADRLEPLGHEAYIMLAQMYSAAGDHNRAADAYQIAMELAPAKAHAVEWDLGMELMEAKRGAEAVEVFGEVLKRNNMHIKVRFMYGRAAYEDGDYPRALFGFREAYTVDHNLDALVWSARCAYDMGDDELAVKMVNRAIEEGKQRAGAGKEFDIDGLWHFVRGRALWQMGDKTAAIDDLEEAVMQYPANTEYARWAIYGYRQLNDPYGVVRIARKYGSQGYASEAMDVIRQIRQMWFFKPPEKDHKGKEYKGGIARLSQIATADMYDEMDQPKTAAVICYTAG